MIKNVLLVDDDTEMLHALKEGFKHATEWYGKKTVSFLVDNAETIRQMAAP
jgi:hypothetical protein